MSSHKTIFIAAFHTLASRNILATDVLKTLQSQPDMRLVIFVPQFKEEFLRASYGADNVIFIGFNERQLTAYFWFSRFTSFTFSFLSTYTVKLRSLEKLHKDKSLRAWIQYYKERCAGAVFSRFAILRRLIRHLDSVFAPTCLLDPYFKTYQPTAVFVTDMFLSSDILFLQTAKRKGVFSIGMVRSWDNTTTKGLMRCLPDRLMVNNEIIKKEAIQLHDVPEDIICVGGTPQYDVGFRENRSPRDEFFTKIGFDSQKRLVLFAPAGQFLSDTDWHICEILKQGLNQGALPQDLQVLVRSHPMDPAPLAQFQPDDRFIIERPGTYFKVETRNANVLSVKDVVAGDPVDLGRLNAKLTEMSGDDLTHLFNSLYHCDILIQVNSTIGIDSLIFDKPDIMIEFDGWEKKPYLESVKRYHDEDHMEKFLQTGAVRIVHNAEELFLWINTYLENPQCDSEHRRRAMQEQLYILDGQSGKRIGRYIYETVMAHSA